VEDFSRLNRIASAGAFFVTRAKDNLRFSKQRSLPVDYPAGVRSDQIGKPTRAKARAAFPSLLRKVRYFDADIGRDFVFLTNHLQIPALTVAKIYRLRWRIELFFRWIKGHLRIKHYYGTSPNAVKTQIWSRGQLPHVSAAPSERFALLAGGELSLVTGIRITAIKTQG
jgi:hypothetical protein